MGSGVILPTPGQPLPMKEGEFVSQTLPNIATFHYKNLEPPPSVYFQRDDLLFMRVWSSVAGLTVGVHTRMLDVNGVVIPGDFRVFPPGDRSLLSTTFQIAEGFLLSITPFLSGAIVRRGQVFMQVGMVRGQSPATFVVAGFVSDYLCSPQFLAWPGGAFRQSVEGPGFRSSLTQAAPAAGADVLITVPVGARWHVIGYRSTLTASAAAANRNVTSVFTGTAGSFYRASSILNQTAGQAITYSFSPSSNVTNAVGGDTVILNPPDVTLMAGDTFGTSTSNLQAGDQWGATIFEVEEWIETT